MDKYKLLMGGDAFFNEDVDLSAFKADYFMFNMEFAYSDESCVLGKVPLVSLYDWKKLIPAQKIIVSLANNHLMDAGDEGFNSTIKYLTENNIAFFGAGTIENSFNNPHIEMIDGQKYAFLGYCTLGKYQSDINSVSFFEKERVLSDLKKCSLIAVDKIIVNMHWGVEESPKETQEQRNIGRWLIDHGVDIVIGHHPHCTQPYEIYKKRYIFYSLGNLYFSDFSVRAFRKTQDDIGIAYRKKQLSWNKKSIVVGMNNHKLSNVDVYKCDYTKKKLRTKKIKRNIESHYRISKFIMYYRKMKSLIVSNTFVEGKVVDVHFFVNEMRMFLKSRRKGKDIEK
ncbi:hypothetical protein M2454_000355 [Aequitasia blattaphilus]|uniref:CapA family protein n=1 Tax=Aequitasia blattaphilus TaxID=2949332 RepID=A0ABT1E675_9FIRM|nr:CapA family protein [Aequitasia blattaphilus]MCP1101253.1 CapA family protein [Aequitasia blattaphilus]MCR8613893.1 CapA family protein [Aequitasia blattaphilus]